MSEVKILKEYFNTNDILYSPDRGYIINGEGDYEIVEYGSSRYFNYLEAEISHDKEELIYLINEIQPHLIDYIEWDKYYEDNYTLEDFNWEPFRYDNSKYLIKKF